MSQKNTSQECLNAITNYLINLSSNTKYFHTYNNKILPLKVTSTINTRTNVVSLVVSNIDSLYYYIFGLI